MALPKINTPTYELKLRTIEEPVKYRPFLVKEEKILMVAAETGNDTNVINAVIDIVKECTFNKIDVTKLPIFDVEYLFLNIRSKSVGESVKVNVKCPDDNKTMVSKEINLNDVKVHLTEEHKNVVNVNDNIKVVLKYPTLKDVTTVDMKNLNELFKVIPNCIESVYEGENIIEDFTKDEAEEFINSLNSQQFGNIQKFFVDLLFWFNCSDTPEQAQMKNKATNNWTLTIFLTIKKLKWKLFLIENNFSCKPILIYQALNKIKLIFEMGGLNVIDIYLWFYF